MDVKFDFEVGAKPLEVTVESVFPLESLPHSSY